MTTPAQPHSSTQKPIAFSPLEIYGEISNDTLSYETDDAGQVTRSAGRNEVDSFSLYRIESFVRIIGSSKSLAFEISNEANGTVKVKWLKLGTLYFKLMNNPYRGRRGFSSETICSPHVLLFFECVEKVFPLGVKTKDPLEISSVADKTMGALFNEMIILIRESLNSPKFKRSLRERHINCLRSYESNRKYITSMFNHYRRVLVIRVDLSYRTAYASGVSMDQAQRDLSLFLNNSRSHQLLGAKIGYITKLEQGIDGGHHFHCFFFYDGSKHQQDAYIAKVIGDYWVNVVTKGRGSYHNCNVNKNKYKRLGIGMVARRDSEMRSNLLLAAKYLSKKEQYIMEKSSAKRKVFRRGVMFSDIAPGPGRPRKRQRAETKHPEILRLEKAIQCLDGGSRLPPP